MKVLVVVDMQNDFITGPLGTKEAQEIVPKVIEKVKNHDEYVYFTQDTHTEDYYHETQEGKILPIWHCIKNTDGWKLPQKLYDAIFEKPHEGSCKPTFASEALGYNLRELHLVSTNGIDEIILCGVCTDICVISNALLLKAFLPEVKITVDASCCAGTSPEAHETALKAMKQCQIFIENADV